MSRRKRSSPVPRLAVFSAETLDLIRGAVQPGGPAFYAGQGFRLLGLGVEVVPGAAGCRAVFKHEEEGDVRSSVLVEPPRRCRLRLPEADAALVSPVACEVSFEDAAVVSRVYPLVAVDMQGFLRSCHRGRLEALRYPPPMLDGVDAVKLSLEDAGDVLAAQRLLGGRLHVMATLGSAGLVGWDPALGCYLCTPPRVEAESTVGAGDMFTAFYIYARLRGAGRVEAACRASTMTAEALAARSGVEPPKQGARLRLLPDCGGGFGLAVASPA
ncbi:MAG: hypothetical protein GXO15_02260 [Crenarchaeota archaeon]|nr:hypothetical protein [Thermoproteota archaeon]